PLTNSEAGSRGPKAPPWRATTLDAVSEFVPAREDHLHSTSYSHLFKNCLKHVDTFRATVHDLDITQVGGLIDWTTGAVEAGGNEERGNIRIPLQQGVNDDNGAETTVHFFISEVSDEDLAVEFGVGYAGILDATPPPLASVGPATFDNGQWTFFGDLSATSTDF
ncbi:MAG: hypothetical protein V3V08_03770, partial [Nannocystaceae bacterium]